MLSVMLLLLPVALLQMSIAAISKNEPPVSTLSGGLLVLILYSSFDALCTGYYQATDYSCGFEYPWQPAPSTIMHKRNYFCAGAYLLLYMHLGFEHTAVIGFISQHYTQCIILRGFIIC